MLQGTLGWLTISKFVKMKKIRNDKNQRYLPIKIFWLPEQLEGFSLKENQCTSKNLKDERNLLTVALAV